MKKYIVPKLLVAILALAPLWLMAFAPLQAGGPPIGTESPLTVPAAIQGLLYIGVVFLLTAGIQAISKHVGWMPTLQGEITVIAGGIVTALVAIANAALALVPHEYIPLAYSILGAIVTFIGANGVAGVVGKFQAPQK